MSSAAARPGAPNLRARPVEPDATLTLEASGSRRDEVVWTLDVDSATVGRRLDNRFVLDDPRVSRLHARLKHIGDIVVLEDLSSTAGTYVNGQRLRGARALRSSDRVHFGPVRAVFRDPRSWIRRDEDTAPHRIDDIAQATADAFSRRLVAPPGPSGRLPVDGRDGHRGA